MTASALQTGDAGEQFAHEEAEEAVIAAMMADRTAALDVPLVLREPQAFWSSKCRLIYQAIVTLTSKDEPTDPLLVATELARTGALEAAGGKDYLGYLIDAVPTTANAAYHARRIREAYDRRLARTALQRAARSIEDPALALSDITRQLSTDIAPAISSDGRSSGFIQLRHVIAPVLEALEEGRRSTVLRGLSTGYPEVDDKLLGVERGDLMLLVGVPSCGKTALGINIAINMALDDKLAIGFVSAEMKKEVLLRRVYTTLAEVEVGHLKDPRKLTAADWERMSGWTKDLATAGIYVDDTPMPDLNDTIAKCHLLKTRVPQLSAIFVDFVQLLQTDRKYSSEIESSVLRRIFYALKGLARTLDVAVIAMAQPNDKEIENRDDKRPQLRDIQGTSGGRQAADIIALVYRPSQYGPVVDRDTIALNFAKVKEGATFHATLEWRGSFMKATTPRRELLDEARLAQRPRQPTFARDWHESPATPARRPA
jgi:replicative DNA helicase